MQKRFTTCRFSIDEELQIIADYEAGLGSERLAQKWDCTQSLIMRLLRYYKVNRRPNRRHFFDERFFEVIDAEAKAYFLGLLSSDGYITEGPKRWVVQLTLTDREPVDALRSAVNGTQPVMTVNLERWHGKPAYMLALCSKLMVQDLVALGVTQAKSHTVTFWHECPRRLLRHYIRGLFDGDGSVGVYQNMLRWSLLGTRDLLDGVVETLSAECGVKNATVHRKGTIWSVSYSQLPAMAICEWMYRDAVHFIPRKRQIAVEHRRIYLRGQLQADLS